MQSSASLTYTKVGWALITLLDYRHFTGDESFMDIEYIGNASINDASQTNEQSMEDSSQVNEDNRDEKDNRHPNRAKARI